MFDRRRSGSRFTAIGPLVLVLILLGSAGISSAANPPDPEIKSISSVAACGTDQPNARPRIGANGLDPNDLGRGESVARERDFELRLRAAGIYSTLAARPVTTVAVDVRVHVITRSDGSGGVSRRTIADQIAVLNDAFAGKTYPGSARTGFRFVTRSVDYTRNDDWYEWDPDVDDGPAKAALHQGGKDDLNIYITGLQFGLLGYASFPWEKSLRGDGVVLLAGSLPGGDDFPYNEGDTATHEVGHWLGLLHTFENGCSGPGDWILDTPSQSDGYNIFYCEEFGNTCAAPGRDPVHNFMAYGDDPCLDRFTIQQGWRMALAWLVYRR